MSKKKYTIDFTKVNYYLEMHGVIRHALEFPDYYGCNWSAFWDCLTNMIGRPIHIKILSFDVIERKFGDTAKKMMETLKDFKHCEDDEYIDSIQIEFISGDKTVILQ